MSVKSWVIKRQLKKKVGLIFAFVFGFFGVVLTCIALLLDVLTDLGTVDDVTIDCGWQQSGNIKYSVGCNAGIDSACKTQRAGEMWLSLEIVSVAFAIGACVLIAVKKNFVMLVFLVCALLCIAGVIAWVANNPLCNGENLPQRSLGVSPILAIVCAVCYLVAAICSSVKKTRGGYTALNSK